MHTRRIVLAPSAVGLLSGDVAAQSPAASFEHLSREVAPGTAVVVKGNDGRSDYAHERCSVSMQPAFMVRKPQTPHRRCEYMLSAARDLERAAAGKPAAPSASLKYSRNSGAPPA